MPCIGTIDFIRRAPLHYVPDRLRLAFKQQVNVVGHQAVGVEEEGRTGLLFDKQGEKLKTIFGRMKNVLSIVPARAIRW